MKTLPRFVCYIAISVSAFIHAQLVMNRNDVDPKCIIQLEEEVQTNDHDAATYGLHFRCIKQEADIINNIPAS